MRGFPFSDRRSRQPGTFWAITKKFKLFLRGHRPPDPPPQVGRCRGLQGCAMAKGCSDLVNGWDCRLQKSQVISNQARRFQKFFLGPIPEPFSATFSSHFLEMRRKTCRKKFRNGAQKKVPESAGLVGACPGLTSDLSTAWLLEAATAADFD